MADDGLVATSTEATLALLKRRKMLFEFMTGTVTNPPNAATAGLGTVPVVLDGDTEPVSAQSLIGAVVDGQRVPIIFVPPNGYMIVGHIADPGYTHTEAGEALFTFTAVASASLVITFATPFANIPVVTGTINSTAGNTNLWFVRAGLISTTGFTLVVSAAAANTWAAVPVGWQATDATQ